MDNNRELLGVIGATETKRAKLTLGWRGATTRLPGIMFVGAAGAAGGAHRPARRAGAANRSLDEARPGRPMPGAVEELDGRRQRPRPGRQDDAGLCGEGDAHGVDLHEAQQANDIRIAQATNAAIDSMARLHVWAIYRACSLASVWRFPKVSLVDVAAEARAELAGKLRKNICTALLF